MSSDDSHNAHDAGHDDEPHGAGHHDDHHAGGHAESHDADPSTVGWEELPFDPMTKFTLLGFLLGRLLDKDESEKQIDVVLNG